MSIKKQYLKTMFTSAILLGSATALATGPQVKTQVPGWFRMMMGDYEVTALNDGYLEFDTKLIQHANQKKIVQGMRDSFIKEKDSIPTSINAFLVNTGTKLVLIDSGAGNVFGPTLGHLIENLEASGYTPSQVDLVLLTHLHGDHANGVVTPEGKMAFPNAIVMTTGPEESFWLDHGHAAHPPKGLEPFFQMANADVAPYQKAGRYKTFLPDSEIIPGIRSKATIGHTAGHTGFLVQSRGEALWVTGDIVHVGSVQFKNPAVSVAYDIEDDAAIEWRKKAFADAAKNRTLLAGAHISFPGIGHLRKEGMGYTFVPVQYLPLK
jgi:glyoxylase-like metal-dependent hydrolase (beta-lactamase superfamily II)